MEGPRVSWLWLGVWGGIDFHQTAKSTVGGKSMIEVRSQCDRGHDQAQSWLPCGKIKATIKAGSRPRLTESESRLIRSRDRINWP